MPDDGIEIELDLTQDPENKDKSKDQGGGEGGITVKPATNKTVSSDDIAALKAELDAAKAGERRAKDGQAAEATRRAEAERTANDTTTRLTTEVEQRLNDQEATVTTSIAAAEGEITALKSLAAKAMEEGKWTDAAQASEDLADAKVRLRELNTQKGQIASYRERVKTEAARPKAPALGTKTTAWIAAHPRFNTDPVYRAAALYAHEKAIRAGVVPESDEYFNQVELETGDKKVETKTDGEDTTIGEGGGKSPANGGGDNGTARNQSGVAPVQRRTNNGSGSGTRPNVIKLSGDQVEAADSLFGDPTNPTLFIKDPKERYTYWHAQQERLKEQGRL